MWAVRNLGNPHSQGAQGGGGEGPAEEEGAEGEGDHAGNPEGCCVGFWSAGVSGWTTIHHATPFTKAWPTGAGRVVRRSRDIGARSMTSAPRPSGRWGVRKRRT